MASVCSQLNCEVVAEVGLFSIIKEIRVFSLFYDRSLCIVFVG